MADTCIVCLGDLRALTEEEPPPELAAPAAEDGHKQSIQSDDEAIAHLLPCKHDLHHSCLKPWVERANSCPICRTIFNMVEISRTVGGPVVDSYAVKDKVQEAEIDASMIVEDELFDVEAWEPCLVCGALDEGVSCMYCDGCDRAVHVFCAGYDDAPEVWYCQTCLVDLERDAELPGMASALRRRPRGRNANANGTANGHPNGNTTRPQPRRRQRNDAIWARVWQEVSRRLDLDLDFPFDEEPNTDVRTEEQRREFRRWQRRFEVANTHGAANRLRGIAQAHLQSASAPESHPESQDELRAWNAFDKARESSDARPASRRRKRRASDSPESPQEPTQEQTEQRQLKRPRLRRPPTANADQPGSSTNAGRRHTEEPTFLAALLTEVENKPISAASPATSDQNHGQQSPRISSPVGSPASSEFGSPQMMGSPPPNRPSSPPLSSELSPLVQTFSPFSPTASRPGEPLNLIAHRGRRRRHRETGDMPDGTEPIARQSSASPSRGLSYSAKEEIQRMVKLALGARYRDKEITKDQYTEINRDVSRKMYELVGDASALADQAERERWQSTANEEVHRAILVISAALADE